MKHFPRLVITAVFITLNTFAAPLSAELAVVDQMGSGAGEFEKSNGIAVTAYGDHIYVASSDDDVLKVFEEEAP
jgi:hypothetical protein